MRKVFAIFVIIVISKILLAQELHLYGGDGHNVYLGCLNCNNYNSNSIWNEYSSYGNSYSSKSIWNEYGTYGSEYSSYSPWNEYSTKSPIVVDKKGNFYGHFTVNEYKSKRADFNLALIIYKFHELIKDNVDKWYDKIFN